MQSTPDERLQQVRIQESELNRLLEKNRRESEQLRLRATNLATHFNDDNNFLTSSTESVVKVGVGESADENAQVDSFLHGNTSQTHVSPLTDTSCTSTEMKVLQEMSLGGGKLEEEYNEGTATLVRKCTKDILWTNTKFLTDNSMHKVDAMSCDEFDGSIVGLLLKTTKYIASDRMKKVTFWRVYGPVVQKELNEIKSNRARVVKDLILKGK